MELKDFISTTLMEIAEGIKDAQAKFEEMGGVVNPSNISIENGLYRPGGNSKSHTDRNYNLTAVEFEVGLTATEDVEEKAGIGVFLNIFGAGMNAKEANADTVVTKVRFQIQVKFPTTRLTV